MAVSFSWLLLVLLTGLELVLFQQVFTTTITITNIHQSLFHHVLRE